MKKILFLSLSIFLTSVGFAQKKQKTVSTSNEDSILLSKTNHRLVGPFRGGRSGTVAGDYKDVDGVMFPQTINVEGSGMGAGSMTFDKIEVNQPVDEKMFKPSK